MYQLMLTFEERKAIDFAGYRYWNGTDLFKLLWHHCCGPDDEWDDPGNITFSVPEHIAWEIRELWHENGCQMDLFSESLELKLTTFILNIV